MTIEQLELRYVPVDQMRRWDSNPKTHDRDGIIEAITNYGFIDPPKFEASLNNGAGGLLYGNGRTEALITMRDRGDAPPRGIALDDAGVWHMPVIFGVDAPSAVLAEAAAVDHNNLTLGTDFTAQDAARMWDAAGYRATLQRIAERQGTPVTVSRADLASLMLAATASVDAPTIEPYREEKGKAPARVQELELVGGAPDVEVDAADDAPPSVASQVRMVNLYLTTETQAEFLKLITALRVHFGTDNPTDTVMETLRYANDHLGTPDADG